MTSISYQLDVLKQKSLRSMQKNPLNSDNKAKSIKLEIFTSFYSF